MKKRTDIINEKTRDAGRSTSRIMSKADSYVRRAASDMKSDIKAVRERDPAAKSDLEVALLYSGVHAIWAHRAAHTLYKRGYELPARAISQGAKFLTGIEIHPGAKIGKGLFIDHGGAVVIGETSEIGDGCTIYQCVTLGGSGKEKGKRHPTLGDNVMVGAGAKVLGGFKIGDNSKIAAGAVVLHEVPPDSTAVGIPARTVKMNGVRVSPDSMDQVHIPDPVAQELCLLRYRITELEGEVSQLKNVADKSKKEEQNK